MPRKIPRTAEEEMAVNLKRARTVLEQAGLRCTYADAILEKKLFALRGK